MRIALATLTITAAAADAIKTESAVPPYTLPALPTDAAAWKAVKDRCTVERIVKNVAEEKGHLVHVGQGWHFDYKGGTRDDDEPLYKLDRHVLKVGEYVSVTEHDGVLRTFRVVSASALG